MYPTYAMSAVSVCVGPIGYAGSVCNDCYIGSVCRTLS